ncbi:MAG: Dabb family protein [Oceanospirillaceae bacterium]|nr:Dabb family protein [Oceanospirillaceae bacterium]MCP5349463.1 Dabb family protein [Oceanospirillaceae bacterium]
MRYLLIVLLFCSQLCAAQDINHLILVWQKKDTPAGQTSAFLQATEQLASIEQVKSLIIRTAIESERPVVDDSFDYAVLMTFASQEDMQHYQDHPQHVQFLNDHVKGKMEKIVIYDF